MGRIKTNEDILYYTGWALLILAGLFVFSVEVLGFRIPGGCLFHLVTGFYCPGCGGTRAVKAMLTGHFLKSLCYHPAVLPRRCCIWHLWAVIRRPVSVKAVK